MFHKNFIYLIALIVVSFSCKKEESIAEPSATIPVVITKAVSDITDNSAIVTAHISSDGGRAITERGFCWSTNRVPTIEDSIIFCGSGINDYWSSIEELEANKKYYIRAFAKNSAGIGYGDTLSFITSINPYTFFGLDSSKIFNLVNMIQNKTFPEIHSLLIVKDDSLILEKYFYGYTRNSTHTLQSVTKSFTSALIGIAIEKGFIESVDEKILSYFPQYTNLDNMNAWKKEIKIKDLLTMRSGTDYSEGFPNSPHDQLNSLSTGWDIFYLNRPMLRAPGTQFNYDSGGVILLSSILKSTCNMHADIFANQYLFPKLGITQKLWFKNSEGHPHTGGGLYLKPIDMIKLGMLYLNKGKWNSEQIVPESWVNKSFEKYVDLTSGSEYAGHPYIKGYGYLWWIFRPGEKSKTNEYIYAAMGAMGQYIFIIPEYKMVVSVTAGTTNYENFENPQKFLYSHILAAVR